MSAPTLLLACATLSLTAACTRDDPVSVLEVTTTVTPTLASIAHDTLGVLVTVQVRNPLTRTVRVVTRPGRFLKQGDGDAMMGESGAEGSWGAGFAVGVGPISSNNKARSHRFGRASQGKAYAFGPGQTLSDTFRFTLRPKQVGGKPDLVAGRFLLLGSWNTLEGAGVEVEVTP